MMFKPMYLLFFIIISITSCNNEELFEEPILEEPIEETPVTPEDIIDTVNPITAPCDFDLANAEINSTIVINCVMDLEGKTINIPDNVTIVYEGGSIVNGTLNFSSESIISGDLLNSSLTLGGAKPLLKDPTFNFNPKRWGIVEGVVSDAVALRNRDILEGSFELVKSLGVSTFIIDAMDAYFKVDDENFKGYAYTYAINPPSNFTLKMSENTHLRTQPTNFSNYALISVRDVENVVIDGGNLYGERDEHDYSSGGSHEFGMCLTVSGSKDVTIKNMTITDALGDGIIIDNIGHTYDSFYTYTDNLLIQNNKIIRSRRNGISIVEGKNIVIDGNELVDTGITTSKSSGAAPMWAIDIEPVWENGIKYQIVEYVTIKNNIERGSEKGGFINARGWYITYENNTMENTIAIGETVGSIVRNNIFKNPGKNSNVAIAAGMNDPLGYGNERNYDNEVYGNTITGFPKGIELQDPGIDLHHNTMIDCGRGIDLLNTRDSKVRDNTITSTVTGSDGIGNHVTSYINNVDIFNNTINVQRVPIRFYEVNRSAANIGYNISIRDNDLTSTGNHNSNFAKIRGFDFKNNICHNSGIYLIEASSANVLNNTFGNKQIKVSQNCMDITIKDNIGCVTDDTTSTNIITLSNTCN
ncbi:right-handed parallel beta-helix repeat-containing protein [Pseudalgibacter alginicilyticus]|nr:right-handed parallel beta-helix repeat-containing protein [Pseudalgibacter alginicilyticus]